MWAGNERSEPNGIVLTPPEDAPLRIFAGIRVAGDIADQLARLARGLERFGVRPVAAADMHLTLVPPWSADATTAGVERVREVAASFADFPLTFAHLGYGPDPRRPRLLWAECEASDVLARLHSALLHSFSRADERPFQPHVTLARLRERGRAIARRHPIARQLTLTQRVCSVELFQSPPAGQRGCRVLASIPLGDGRRLLPPAVWVAPTGAGP